MSEIRRAGEGESTWMEPHLTGDSLTWESRTETQGHWQCLGCGLVWSHRNHARDCESRGHVAHWMAGPYGCTGVINGVLQGNLRYYPRDAVRRDPLPEREAVNA